LIDRVAVFECLNRFPHSVPHHLTVPFPKAETRARGSAQS